MDSMVLSTFQFFVGAYFTTGLEADGVTCLTGDAQAFNLFNSSYVSVDSINRAIVGVTQAMSIQARQWNSDGKSTFDKSAQGVAYVNDTCVRVHWGWIIYLAAISLLTTCFLVAVLIQTEIRDRDGLARGWKSSLLPLIYHGISSPPHMEDTTDPRTDNIRSMMKAADKETGYIKPASASHMIPETSELLSRPA